MLLDTIKKKKEGSFLIYKVMGSPFSKKITPLLLEVCFNTEI